MKEGYFLVPKNIYRKKNHNCSEIEKYKFIGYPVKLDFCHDTPQAN